MLNEVEGLCGGLIHHMHYLGVELFDGWKKTISTNLRLPWFYTLKTTFLDPNKDQT